MSNDYLERVTADWRRAQDRAAAARIALRAARQAVKAREREAWLAWCELCAARGTRNDAK